MNKFSTFNQNESSRQKFRFLSMQQMLHRVVAMFILAFVCAGAWAADYYATLNLTVNNDDYGTVTGGGDLITNTQEGNVTFTNITATPNLGCRFVRWEFTSANTGTITSPTSATTSVVVTASTKAAQNKNKKNAKEYTLQAVFEELPKPTFYYRADVGLIGTGGTATVTDGTSTPSTSITGSVKAESAGETSATVSLTYRATPENTNYDFVGWYTSNTGAGDPQYTQNPYSIDLDCSSTNESAPTVAPTLYAKFAPFPIFRFSANVVNATNIDGTISESNAGGSTSVTIDQTEVKGAHWNTASASTNVTFSVTEIKPGYKFEGWTNELNGAIVSTQTEYTIKAQNSTSGSTLNTQLYARFKKVPDPTSITAIPTTIEALVGETSNISVSLQPAECYRKIEFTSADASVSTVDANGVVTAIAVGTTTITVQAVKADGTKLETLRKTVTVIVKDKCATPVITFTPTSTDNGATATTTITTTTDGAKIYYTVNGDTPDETSTLYEGAFTVNNLDVVKAIAILENWINSNVASATYSTHKVPMPTINISSSGVTFSCEETGVTFYYTIDGSTPTTSSTQWDGNPFTPTSDECTIKVIAAKTGAQNSDVAEKVYVVQSGVKGGTVILNDYEDHNWTYYKGVDERVDEGHYNTTYLNKMYSPDPRNVKITYRGGGVEGASAVAISGATGEDQNTMVYYETIEKTVPGMSGEYPYLVISNPFSKRPKSGTQYYGFGGWKVVDGGEYIAEYGDGDTMPLDPTVHFTNLDTDYTPNCTSAEIVLEATWVPATVYVQTAKPTFTGGTYETNFWVINGNADANFTFDQNMTVAQMTPDGGASGDYRATAMTRTITYGHSATMTPKLEWINLSSNSTFDALGYNLFVGRGVTTPSASTSSVIGCQNTSHPVNQIVRIESGTYQNGRHYSYGNTDGSAANNITRQILIWGCDYDRAKNDNTKLTIRNGIRLTSNSRITTNASQVITQTYIKSGRISSTQNPGDGSAEEGLYYMGSSSGTKHDEGCRYYEIQGGELCNIAGGSQSHSTTENQKIVCLTLRIRGGYIRGMVFGCSRNTNSNGSRAFVLTGGEIKGWIAPGANGTGANNGKLEGYGYLYVGGDARIDSKGDLTAMNRSVGGNAFGAGCGYSTTSTSGSVLLGSNVVMADEAYVERGVYGGGSYGYNEASAYMYITGGLVDGKYTGASTGNAPKNLPGGVYGGSQMNDGTNVHIYMTGGTVKSGLYGGSNSDGDISEDVTMQIYGGQVGTDSETANVHGGGYGQSTTVKGNVDVSLGLLDTTTGDTSGNVVIYGDVYGGSALGSVNDAATDHTNVTLNAGTINGSLYGGGLGNNTVAANVYGPVQVTVNGGTVNTTSASGSGAVYGCNNINGAPQSTVKVDIYGTDPAPSAEAFALDAVYGGGNMAHYAAGTPVVVIHNCDNSIGSVYGGGNAADITNGDTDVTIWGGNVIGKVFGGGNGEREGTQANISGGTNVTIHGGTILEVYGGSNTRGTIGGTINVNVNAQAEEGHDACPIDIDNVYGGGNKAASAAGNITIGCAEHIGAVYGGANQANVTGDINLSITSGHIDNVFGGNNNSGEISGSITVTVHDSGNTCGMAIGNVFGAGNLATYGNGGNYPVVNILNGTISGNVFGGGKGDATDNTHTMGSVTGNPQVTIGDDESDHHVIIKGDVYGGGDAAKVDGMPFVTINDCDTKIGVIEGDVKSSGTVYGGGNAAPVTGTNVTVNGGQIYNVFGGGHGDIADNISADVNGNVSMLIKGGTIDKVFAGSNAKGAISGSSTLEINKPSDGTCEMHITEVYGGGNQAAGNAGTVSIVNTGGETEGIQDVYGGAREANVTSNISLNITGGNINRVFGGNNISGSISGAISVNVNWSGTGYRKLGSVYGGGNLAPYTGSPTVYVVNATTTGSVFGGGLGKPAVVVGDPIVNIGSWTEGTVVIGGNVFGGGDEAAVEGNPTVTIRDCDTEIRGDLYGGGNAAPVYSTNTTMWGGTVYGNVFGGGNGSDATKNPKGAQVGYTRNDETTAGSGNAVTNIYGGTIGTWSGDPAACAANTGGIFGGSNTTGNINGKVMLTLDQRTCTETGAAACPLVLSEVYGSGNNAAYAGTGIDFNLGCVSSLDEIYGGAKNADMTGDIHLTISSGRYKRVFAGNNLGGNIKGSIKVTIEETGCEPVRIGELYGGGNMAIYSVYGYNSDNTPITSGTPIYNAPEVNVYSCTSIGTVFGGGLGLTADEINALPEAEREAAKEKGKTYGDTHVNISMIPGIHAATALGDANKIGVIGEVFGGGNASDVAGDTYVNIGTLETVTLTTGDEDHKDKTFDAKGINVSGNVYGGGNAAHVTGKTHVQVGKAPTPAP